MPYSDKEKQKRNYAKWVKKNKARRTLTQRSARLKSITKYLATQTKNNRKKGYKERVTGGPRAKKKVHVPVQRRYRIIPDPATGVELVYFSRETGYTKKELKEILALL